MTTALAHGTPAHQNAAALRSVTYRVGMAALIPAGEVGFGFQLPIQTLTRTLRDPWEDEATPDDLVRIVQRAEEVGMDFVGVCDHVAIPDNDYAQHMTTTWYDTVTTLAYLAAKTEKINLLSVVYIAAYRHPLLAAKMWGTLDHLSGGRAIMGVGAGHVEAEFDALGVDFAKRGALLDETLAAVSGAFASEYVSHSGEAYQYQDVGVAPAPPSGELTIWVGGGGKAAQRRVGQYGHGFVPFTNPHDSYPELIANIQAAAEDAGRGDTQFDIGIFTPWMYVGEPPEGIGPHQLAGSPEVIAEELRREQALGANVHHLKFRGRDIEEYLDQVEAFGTEVIPLVRS